MAQSRYYSNSGFFHSNDFGLLRINFPEKFLAINTVDRCGRNAQNRNWKKHSPIGCEKFCSRFSTHLLMFETVIKTNHHRLPISNSKWHAVALLTWMAALSHTRWLPKIQQCFPSYAYPMYTVCDSVLNKHCLYCCMSVCFGNKCDCRGGCECVLVELSGVIVYVRVPDKNWIIESGRAELMLSDIVATKFSLG